MGETDPPRDSPPAGPLSLIWGAVMHGVLWCLLLGTARFAVGVDRALKEFEAAIPLATRYLLIFEQSLARYWWLYTLAFLVIEASMFAILRRKRSYFWSYIGAGGLAFLLYVLIFVVLLVLPLLNLVHGLSN